MNITIQIVSTLAAATLIQTAWAQDPVKAEPARHQALVSGKAEVTIKAKSQGELTELGAVEGRLVKRGELLAKIDDKQEKINLRMAKVESRMAKDDYTKTSKLKKYVSKDEVLQKEAAYLKKQSVAELKELELANTRITSPVDGMVTRAYFDLGETVAVGDKVFEVVQMDELVLVANVPAQEAKSFPMDAEIPFKVENSAQTYRAKVTFVSPVINASSDTIRIKLNVVKPAALKPGMIATLLPKE